MAPDHHVMAGLLLFMAIVGMVGANAKRNTGNPAYRGIVAGLFAGVGLLALVIVALLILDPA